MAVILKFIQDKPSPQVRSILTYQIDQQEYLLEVYFPPPVIRSSLHRKYLPMLTRI